MAITHTKFQFPGQTQVYHGKVRDVYFLENNLIVVIATDRISAFDVILPRPIPFKGQVLNMIAAKFLSSCIDVSPNWYIRSPHPRVSIGYYCAPIRIEMVVRAYLTGHAWRTYVSGKRTLCGVPLPNGLRENDRLPHPIITPATKADEGHDEDISQEDILKKGIVTAEVWRDMERYALDLFERGTEMAAARDLILVDTKYEFGLRNNMVYLIDEIHTPDSSRYFYKSSYETLQNEGKPQKHLSKEFVREWLMSQDFQGKAGQTLPEMTDEVVQSIANRYTELYEKIIGRKFVSTVDDSLEAIEASILKALENIAVQ